MRARSFVALVLLAAAGVAHAGPVGGGAVTGGTSCTVSGVLNLKCPPYNAKGNGVSDDTAAVQAWLNAVASSNSVGRAPAGVYAVSAGLTIAGVQATGVGKRVVIEGAGDAVDGDGRGTTFKWIGSSNVANTLLKVSGVFKLSIRGVALDGGGKVGKVFWATQAGGTFAPYGWTFDDVVFRWAIDGGYAFYLDTTTDHARHRFNGCTFSAFGGAGPTIWTGYGFYSSNQNSLNNTFTNCNFQFNAYGYYLDGGSGVISGGEMTNNSVTDVYLNIHEAVTLVNIHSEQSRQFVIGTGPGGGAGDLSVTIIGCKVASYPWAFWKFKGGAQPTNDATQWAAMVWSRDTPINFWGSVVADPANGASMGGAAPTTSQLPGIYNNTVGQGSRVDTSGSVALLNPYVQQKVPVYSDGGTIGYLAPAKRGYHDWGDTWSAWSADIHYGAVQRFNLIAPVQLNLNTSHADPGDELTLIFTQGGTGSYTITWSGGAVPKLAGGAAFTPTAAVGAKSALRLQWDGTNWHELSRTLDLK